jgi:sulfur-oxidizing protein SoxY
MDVHAAAARMPLCGAQGVASERVRGENRPSMPSPLKRRRLLAAVGAMLALPVRAIAQSANAHVNPIDPLIWSITQGRPVRPGRVTLDLPKIAESGHSVAMTVSVASPMTEAEHVRAIHLIAEKNPVREMASFYFGPYAVQAEVSSRIRLNGSQRVVAIGELSDGTFWSAAADIEVAEAACTEEG